MGTVNNKKELEILHNDLKQINDNLDDIYIDKLNKKITEEQFERVKLKLENELLTEYIHRFLSMKKPNRELIINLIDRIEIFENKNINIRVTFKDVY